MTTLHTLALITADRPGVLQRVAGLFSRRGYNIESITVGEAEREGTARMTIVAPAPPQGIDQVVRQLSKLIDVLEVRALPPERTIGRELLLAKLRLGDDRREVLRRLAAAFPCAVLDVSAEAAILQTVGTRETHRAFLRAIAPYEVLELCRTGETAMERLGK